VRQRGIRTAPEILLQAATTSGATRRRFAIRRALAIAAGATVAALSVYGFASTQTRVLTWRSNDQTSDRPSVAVDSNRAAPIERNRIGAAEHLTVSAPRGRPAVPQAAVVPRSPRQPPRDDFARAVEYQRQGDFDKAAALYQSLLQRDELPAQVHNNLGLINHARGEFDLAVREFESAIARDPEYARAYGNLGVALLARNQVDRAVEHLRSAAELDPSDPTPLVNLALAHKAAGKPQLARETLLTALVLSPEHAPAHYNLAVLYDQAGERALAVEHYRAFLEHRGDEYAPRAADARERIAALDTRR
jgi:tetratricopeptide (TPR) repeat protein